MGDTNYTDIIDFAIRREWEAVQFYRELQALTKFASQKEMLVEIQKMEESHAKLLETTKKKSPVNLKSRKLESFEPDDYIVEAPPTSEMSLQDILITAMKREERSYALYTELKEQADDEELVKTFDYLAGEETQHKNFFQELYDNQVRPDN